MKISEVKEILAGEPDPDQVAELAADERSGCRSWLPLIIKGRKSCV